jgi:exopolysaccharide/PEP-CTERM locus tyrosine autokinase
MSNIRKALRELRGTQRGTTTASPERAADAPGNSGQRGKEPVAAINKLTTPVDASAVSQSFDASQEPIVKRKSAIDRARLQETGLLPGPEDSEVISQQFRRIKRPILKLAFEEEGQAEENANVIMVASAMPGAGKSFCACNLAHSISMERDVGVLLVDADVLKPGITEEFGLEDTVGLIDYLLDPNVELSDIVVATNLNGVLVIPSGRRHEQATELLASRRMKDLVASLSHRYKSRAVIFDAPPLLLTNEAQVLSNVVGQVVLVIESRVSTQESMSRAVAMLDPDKPINAILNKSRSAAGKDYRGYGYGYGYYPYGSDEDSSN